MFCKRCIDSPEAMIETVRRMGVIPFFKNPVTGWSVEEMTAPGCWWDTEGVLGPWDWKIDVIHAGMAYGKLFGDRAAFATEGWYRELMNYRRSLPKYRPALGERPRARAGTKHEKLMRILAKPALDAIRRAGSLESGQLRRVLSESITPSQVRSLGASYKSLLTPSVKKSISDSVLTYLQMGTWCVVGDIRRVYRGPDLTYSGWQTSSNTTPEEYWGDAGCVAPGDSCTSSGAPSWAWRLEEEPSMSASSHARVSCSPEESRMKIVNHIHELFPDAPIAVIEKLV